jgi:peptide/nickel transport system ATP-binding protein
MSADTDLGHEVADPGREPVVSLENVSIEFSKSKLFGLAQSQTIRAVNDVSLSIEEEEVVALVGESGCGKTTLGKTAIGLHRPASGTVRYRGQDIFEAKDADRLSAKLFSKNRNLKYDHDEIRRSLQIIHQDPESALHDQSRIESILSEPLRRWQPEMDRNDRRERIYGFLDYVGMNPPEEYADRFPHQLSGGEQQRVALIRALLMNPDLILADESISALDVSLRISMMDLMLDLQEQFGTSFLYITHDISNARYIAEKSGGRIGVMYLGNLVEIGPVEQVINNPQHPYTKALMWATPDFTSTELLERTQRLEDAPLQTIDVPDMDDPPSGCFFHPRCPEAREACTRQEPQSIQVGDRHTAECFRHDDTHEYWDSPELHDEELSTHQG